MTGATLTCVDMTTGEGGLDPAFRCRAVNAFALPVLSVLVSNRPKE